MEGFCHKHDFREDQGIDDGGPVKHIGNMIAGQHHPLVKREQAEHQCQV
jgi:hypothetical protein